MLFRDFLLIWYLNASLCLFGQFEKREARQLEVNMLTNEVARIHSSFDNLASNYKRSIRVSTHLLNALSHNDLENQ